MGVFIQANLTQRMRLLNYLIPLLLVAASSGFSLSGLFNNEAVNNAEQPIQVEEQILNSDDLDEEENFEQDFDDEEEDDGEEDDEEEEEEEEDEEEEGEEEEEDEEDDEEEDEEENDEEEED